MTDNEKNIAVSKWLGLTVTQGGIFGGITYTQKEGYPKREMCNYLNTNAAFDLLDVLAEKGLTGHLVVSLEGSRLNIYDRNQDIVVGSQTEYTSKSRAVVEAVLALIEKEKEK